MYYADGYSAVAALWNLAGRSTPTVYSSQETLSKPATAVQIHTILESAGHGPIQGK